MTRIPRPDPPPRLSIEHSEADGVHVVTVRGEIDFDVRDVLHAALLTAQESRPPLIVVHLGGVTFMDSSGINVFAAAHQRVGDAGGRLVIACATEAVLRTLEVTALDTLIDCYPTLEEAREH